MLTLVVVLLLRRRSVARILDGSSHEFFVVNRCRPSHSLHHFSSITVSTNANNNNNQQYNGSFHAFLVYLIALVVIFHNNQYVGVTMHVHPSSIDQHLLFFKLVASASSSDPPNLFYYNQQLGGCSIHCITPAHSSFLLSIITYFNGDACTQTIWCYLFIPNSHNLYITH
jgi:hypothetical protein